MHPAAPNDLSIAVTNAMPLSLRARTVVPVDRPPIDDGVVTIEDERIVAVGPARRGSGPVRDLGDVVLLPGPSTRTRISSSAICRRRWAGRECRSSNGCRWRLPNAGDAGTKAVQSIATGIQECILAGTCAIGDIATVDPAAYEASSQLEILSFLEVIGFSRARADSAFAAVKERIAELPELACRGRGSVPTRLHGFARVGWQARGTRPRAPDCPWRCIWPRVPRSSSCCSTAPVRSATCSKRASMWDDAAIARGSRPLDYLQLLAEAPRSLVIHGNYLADDEHEFLAAHADRMTLVYCPRTHAYFSHPPYPLAQAARRPASAWRSGTDSRASNPDLNMLGEMRHAARAHRAVQPEAILKMATLTAARALGCDHECG